MARLLKKKEQPRQTRTGLVLGDGACLFMLVIAEGLPLPTLDSTSCTYGVPIESTGHSTITAAGRFPDHQRGGHCREKAHCFGPLEDIPSSPNFSSTAQAIQLTLLALQQQNPSRSLPECQPDYTVPLRECPPSPSRSQPTLYYKLSVEGPPHTFFYSRCLTLVRRTSLINAKLEWRAVRQAQSQNLCLCTSAAKADP